MRSPAGDARVAIGDELPPLRRETGFGNWNRFAAVNDEFVPIHMDDEAGREAGQPSAIGMGNLQWSYLHNLLRDWLGGHGRISRLRAQFRGVNTKGMTVTARGVVTGLEVVDGVRTATLDVWTEDQDGNKLVRGEAEVQLDSN
jgi:acyl dehydratase